MWGHLVSLFSHIASMDLASVVTDSPGPGFVSASQDKWVWYSDLEEGMQCFPLW